MRIGDRYKIQRRLAGGQEPDEIVKDFSGAYTAKEVKAVIKECGNATKDDEAARKRSEAAKKAAATRKAKAEAAANAEADSGEG